ncbi:hypothetical protein ACH4OY_27875 [Micromonospora rubida]|uniref:Uncharacterized protein n=1 Tax=Micromonospora rubida TaxID=2697657 RepID=A0ABW7SRY8_9ACTN
MAFWVAVRHGRRARRGFLVVDAMAAATINVFVPERWLQTLADDPVLSVLALAGASRSAAAGSDSPGSSSPAPTGSRCWPG